MRQAGYRIRLDFLWVSDLTIARQRVSNRVAKGGHDIPEEVQERRFGKGIRLLAEHYRSLLSMNDRGEPSNRAAILVTPLGQGTYIYTTLSLFRQLPAGVPGGARIFLNLLSANVAPTVTP
jgi:predicted ABC-type ATPase